MRTRRTNHNLTTYVFLYYTNLLKKERINMAHVRKNCRNISTTISLEEEVMKLIEDYRFSERKDNRSAAIADLIIMGTKYKHLVEKKREKNRLRMPV